jgi:hypothetical protein
MDAKASGEAAEEGGGLRTRWVELVFALLIAFAGAVVIYDSVRIGAEWESDGPQAGYFPWLTGWALVLCGIWLAIVTFARWKTVGDDVFTSWARLKPVLAMLVPSIAYVALIYVLGIYVASAIFIAFFMLWKGRFGIVKTLAVSLSVPAVLFALFEVWFLVPLPKGPLERMLGY